MASSKSKVFDRDVPTQAGVDACVCFADMTSIPLEILLDAKQMCEDISIDIVVVFM